MRSCQRPLGWSLRSLPLSTLVKQNHTKSRVHKRRCSRVACKAAAEKRFAVIGAGLAGLATAYHLQKLAAVGHAVHVDVYDAAGIGSGGSGAAAGLLHPCTPKGKLLWKAEEAMSAALELLQAAEAAAAAAQADNQQLPGDQTISWHTGMIRAAANTKQSQDFWKIQIDSSSSSSNAQQQQQQPDQHQQHLAAAVHSMLTATVLDSSSAQRLLPSIKLPTMSHHHQQQQQKQQADVTAVQEAPAPLQQQQQQQTATKRQHRQQQQRQQQKLEGWQPSSSAALHIPGGITLHPQRYMHALFAAAQAAAAARNDGSKISLHIQRLHSLKQLNNSSSKQYDAVVVAAGAAVGSLKEFAAQQLPLSLCQGYTLDMIPPTPSPSPAAAAAAAPTAAAAAAAPTAAAAAYGSHWPSILGSPYLASQGGSVLVVGATKSFGWSAEQATMELGRTINTRDIYHHRYKQQQQQQEKQQQQSSDQCGRLLAGHQMLAAHQQQQQQGGQDDDGDHHHQDDHSPAVVASAASDLLSGAAAVWPGVIDWQLSGVRSGVRAIPPRTKHGSVPLLGRWNMSSQQQLQQQQDSDVAGCEGSDNPPVWLVLGLGARGLVYHAWLGRLTAAAALHDDEQVIAAAAPELLAWRGMSGGGGDDDQMTAVAGGAAAMKDAE